MSGSIRCTPVLIILALILTTSTAVAQQVITVPYQSNDPTVPHPAYNGHATRFKAIARGLGTSNPYFRWDLDGDGTWDNCMGRSLAIPAGNWYQDNEFCLDCLNYMPTVTEDQMFIATIQVAAAVDGSGNPTASSYYGSYPIYIRADVPSGQSSAHLATPDQLKIMEAVALGDALWYQHCQMTRVGSGFSAIFGYMTQANFTSGLTATAQFLLALENTGHMPAYPTGTYNEHGGGASLPPGFYTDNDFRWNTDPYAEDAVRLFNFLMNQIGPLTIPAIDEGDDGTPPITGTNDLAGFYLTSTENEYNPGAMCLAALSRSGLANTRVQVTNANVNALSTEYVVQQMVDYAVAAQVDLGGNAGGWDYTPRLGTTGTSYAPITGGWCQALMTAEQAMGSYGVYVNDWVKSRIPYMLMNNQDAVSGGPEYYNTYGTPAFETVGMALLTAQWMDWDQWTAGDGTATGYPFGPATRGACRIILDNYLNHAQTNWTLNGVGSGADGVGRYLWTDGNYSSMIAGHSWYYAIKQAKLAGDYGLPLIGTHDWEREFGVDYVATQETSGRYGVLGTGYWMNSYFNQIGYTSYVALTLAPYWSIPAPDWDFDGIVDANDNCPYTYNPGQADFDGDGDGDVCDLDADDDGLSNDLEAYWGTDPLDKDSDDDTLNDYYELSVIMTDPLLADTDGDGLTDDIEDAGSTWARDIDTDDDGISDGDEDADHDGTVDPSETDPMDADTDNDLLNDGLESGVTVRYYDGTSGGTGVPIYGTAASWQPDTDNTTITDALDTDTDNDGLDDGIEDADGDGAMDGTESDPLDADTDDDAVADGDEAPRLCDPLIADSDSDDLSDGLELGRTVGISSGTSSGLMIAYVGTGPGFVPDGDGGASTTDPADPDSDDDMLNDGVEDADSDGAVDVSETDPNDDDSDDDLLSDGDEVLSVGSDPLDADTDDDSVDDYDEVFADGGSIGSPPNTDGDAYKNFADPDDDDDGIPTIDEDDNGNGDPTDDDYDTDGIADYLDDDDDNDGIANQDDNCPRADNAGQEDDDSDTWGDVCDNCPYVSNPGQEDADSDGTGDVCETCCVHRVGDANGLGGDEPTIGDVSVMIDAKFITGTCAGIIPCLAEADINGSGGSSPTCDDITIGDISTLIDYLFITGPSLGLPTCL